MGKKDRDQSADVPPDEATKPQKPKKAFEMTVTFWDDCEITSKLVEFIKKERGAPEKWHRTPEKFSELLKKNVSESPAVLLEKVAEAIGINLPVYTAAKAGVKVEDSEKK